MSKKYEKGKFSVIGANGKPCVRVGGSCSCCAVRDHEAGEPDVNGEVSGRSWFVYRAGWSDGEDYFARLCGDEFGVGCISEIAPAKPVEDHVTDGLTSNEAASILRELMPGEEDDGVVTEMEDFGK